MDGSSPLYDRLIQHEALNRASFHTPGHKGRFFDPSLLRLDYTELPDTDALYEANDVILRTEQRAAELFGAGRSLISAGGCSLAIQTMLRLAAMRGGRILCARNAHRSAVNAMALLGLDPVWLIPDGGNGYTGRIDPASVRDALEKYPGITSCYITSPSYYGELCDIRTISEICHEHGVWLLVDNAHGSHLAFLGENRHPLALGADMTACSLHKTLPVLTGGALLNIAKGIPFDEAKQAMALFGSTSPSYLIMSSIDLCITYMNGRGREDYRRCEETVSQMRDLADRRGIPHPRGECDPLRLTLDTAAVGLIGQAQQEYFESCGIDCEFCDGENAVLIITPFNTEDDIGRVRKAVVNMPVSEPVSAEREKIILPEKKMTIREAMLSPSEEIGTACAAGRIAADTACPCPPGVPVIMPGEVISSYVEDRLLQNGINRIRCLKDRC